ncbi:hypothetical protein PRIPAC_78573 [Pristionchus pacificus]|uniref:Uncharacterized protein n=1 Tax=Pristionchus pacificus TaxID=54126 RepID=A0A2A6BHL6_PRIPA|nr:hypothetical protein PRIPAC_78573 [Pristionchus pacificus]|eukprot:PDM65338.1 hypothetical protein PRIPAC_52280 [Pristionchus pacificus]
MAELKPTPEMIEKFKKGRATLKASPTLLDDSIDKLSAGAQEPAKKFRDLMLSDEEDMAKFHVAATAIKTGLAEDVMKELEAHRAEVIRILDLPAGPA